RREFLKRSALGVAALAGSGILADASPAAIKHLAETNKHVIGFDHPFTNAPVVHYVQHFALQEAKALGYKVLLTNDQGKLDAQVSAIESFITQKVGAITCLPIEVSALEPLAAKARKQGILWFTYYATMKNQDGMLGINQSTSGNVLGKYAAQWINSTLGGKAE